MAFRQFTRIAVGVTEAVIRAPVALLVVDTPHRKTLVARHFLWHIKQLAETESFSAEYILITIASYFDFEPGTTEVQSEQEPEGIRSDFVADHNLFGVGFRDNYNKAVFVADFVSPLLL